MTEFDLDSISKEMNDGQGFVATLFASWAHAMKM